MQVSPQLHYAMISLATGGDEPPTSIKDFLLLKVSQLYREENSSECLSYRFLLCGTNAYLYNHRSIIVIKPQEDPDTIDINTPQDFLLGELYVFDCLLFCVFFEVYIHISNTGNVKILCENYKLQFCCMILHYSYFSLEKNIYFLHCYSRIGQCKISDF